MLSLRIIRKLCMPSTLLYLETNVIDEQFQLPDKDFLPFSKVNPLLYKTPIMQFCPADTLNKDYTNYWIPNITCMKEMLGESCFDIVDEVFLKKDNKAIFTCKPASEEARQYYIDLAYGKDI